MSRPLTSLALLTALGSVATGADAADWSGVGFRDSYEGEWALEEDNPISIEMGTRYWYALGSSRLTDTALGTYQSNDTSHIVETHLRIDDSSSDFYTKALAGYSAVINNTFSTPTSGGTVLSQAGSVGYVGGDVGWTPLGTDGFKFGGFIGYQYWHDSPDMGRALYVNSGGGGSEINTIYTHLARLGISGRAEIGDMVDITGEIAAIPYAQLGGTYGAIAIPAFVDGGVAYQQGSAATLDGWLYGAAGEVMVGFHPTENWTFRLGGRAWYLQGQAQVKFTATEIGSPGNAQLYTTLADSFSMLRYGGLAEITYRF